MFYLPITTEWERPWFPQHNTPTARWTHWHGTIDTRWCSIAALACKFECRRPFSISREKSRALIPHSQPIRIVYSKCFIAMWAQHCKRLSYVSVIKVSTWNVCLIGRALRMTFCLSQGHVVGLCGSPHVWVCGYLVSQHTVVWAKCRVCV